MSEQLVLPGAAARAPQMRTRSFVALCSALRPLRSWTGGFGVAVLLIVVFVAAFAAELAPYDPTATQYDAHKQVLRLEPPSAAHWLGTTNYGVDVLSQLIYGSRIVLIVGVACAVLIGLIGTNVGLIAGYYRGRVDNVLMRVTDLAFGIPFLPFAVVLVTLLRPSLWNTIIAISVLMWRTSARVIRVQVLSLRERGFVKAAWIAGASDLRILYIHIFPNVLPMVLLYVAFDIAWAVLAEASISFLGFGDPIQVSWGQMLYLDYVTGSIRQAWWWTLPPGFAISLFVIAVFLVARRYERLAGLRRH